MGSLTIVAFGIRWRLESLTRVELSASVLTASGREAVRDALYSQLNFDLVWFADEETPPVVQHYLFPAQYSFLWN